MSQWVTKNSKQKNNIPINSPEFPPDLQKILPSEIYHITITGNSKGEFPVALNFEWHFQVNELFIDYSSTWLIHAGSDYELQRATKQVDTRFLVHFCRKMSQNNARNASDILIDQATLQLADFFTSMMKAQW